MCNSGADSNNNRKSEEDSGEKRGHDGRNGGYRGAGMREKGACDEQE